MSHLDGNFVEISEIPKRRYRKRKLTTSANESSEIPSQSQMPKKNNYVDPVQQYVEKYNERTIILTWPKLERHHSPFCKLCGVHATRGVGRDIGVRKHIIITHFTEHLYKCPYCTMGQIYDRTKVEEHIWNNHKGNPNEVIVNLDRFEKHVADKAEECFGICYTPHVSVDNSLILSRYHHGPQGENNVQQNEMPCHNNNFVNSHPTTIPQQPTQYNQHFENPLDEFFVPNNAPNMINSQAQFQNRNEYHQNPSNYYNTGQHGSNPCTFQTHHDTNGNDNFLNESLRPNEKTVDPYEQRQTVPLELDYPLDQERNDLHQEGNTSEYDNTNMEGVSDNFLRYIEDDGAHGEVEITIDDILSPGPDAYTITRIPDNRGTFATETSLNNATEHPNNLLTTGPRSLNRGNCLTLNKNQEHLSPQSVPRSSINSPTPNAQNRNYQPYPRTIQQCTVQQGTNPYCNGNQETNDRPAQARSHQPQSATTVTSSPRIHVNRFGSGQVPNTGPSTSHMESQRRLEYVIPNQDGSCQFTGSSSPAVFCSNHSPMAPVTPGSQQLPHMYNDRQTPIMHCPPESPVFPRINIPEQMPRKQMYSPMTPNTPGMQEISQYQNGSGTPNRFQFPPVGTPSMSNVNHHNQQYQTGYPGYSYGTPVGYQMPQTPLTPTTPLHNPYPFPAFLDTITPASQMGYPQMNPNVAMQYTGPQYPNTYTLPNHCLPAQQYPQTPMSYPPNMGGYRYPFNS